MPFMKWTKSEIKQLEEIYESEEYSKSAVIQHFRRSWGSIEGKALKLGLNRPRGKRTKQLKNYPPLSECQIQLIEGSLLGDGWMSKHGHGKNSSFAKEQTSRSREYLEWHYQVLQPYSSNIHDRKERVMNWGNRVTKTQSCHFYTCNHFVFNEMRDKWYPNNKKVIPKNLKLSPLALATWHCDDGSNDAKTRRIFLNTQGFTFDECEYLIDLLQCQMGIASSINKNRKKPTIYISMKSYSDFIEIVKPHIIVDCMQYKCTELDYAFNEKQYTKEYRPWTNEETVKSICKMYHEGYTVKDLSLRFDMNNSVISNILKGKTYKNIDRPTIDIHHLRSTSGHPGVGWCKRSNKWRATTTQNGKNKYLGLFKQKEDAISAVNEFQSSGEIL